MALSSTAFAAGNLGSNQAIQDLNVRFQPKLGNNRIDHLKKDQIITVKKVLGTWCQIEYKKYKNAYVACNQLKLLENMSSGDILSNEEDTLETPTAKMNYQGITREKNENGNWTIGSKDAPVKLEEFMDFQCPYCTNYLSAAPKLRNYVKSGKLYYVLYNYPLGYHAQAQDAAEVALCAGDQDKYWEMHDLLLKNQDLWSDNEESSKIFENLAKKLKLNVDTLNKCLASDKYLDQINKDRDEGSEREVSSISAFFLNGKFLPSDKNTYKDIMAKLKTDSSSKK